jgi:hypothetical protein
MKTQCLEASVVAQSSPRIFARSGAPLQASGGTPQLVDFPGEAPVLSFQNTKELCSGACMNARKQLVKAWSHASRAISQARTKASAWILRAWGNTSALLSCARMEVREHSSRAWKTSFVLISRMWAHSVKQSSCAWKRIRAQQIARSNSKRLHVAETVSLGEKRFVAVIKVDGREFLIGGGASNVALLAQLGTKKQLRAKKSFDGILTEKMTVSKKQPAKRATKKAAKPPVEKPGRQS